jgi:MoxR-like ATPase
VDLKQDRDPGSAGTPDTTDPLTGFSTLRAQLRTRIIGQEALIDRLIIALLGDGHLLVEGAPGLAKTTAIKELAARIEGDFHRVQFTPDLLPADLTGTEIYRPQDGSFQFQKGPIFHNLLLADEINRAPAKTQAALLEVMQEHQVTLEGSSMQVPTPFMTLATQNPIEQEGTYPLPEAQLDRFLMEIGIGYPDLEAERQMLIATTGAEQDEAVPVMTPDELIAAQRLVRRVPVGESVVEAILALVRMGRPEVSELSEVRAQVAWGPGPRASQSLMLAVRAQALLDGRLAPSIDDVVELAGPVLRHRMALNFAARAEGITVDDIIERLCQPFA